MKDISRLVDGVSLVGKEFVKSFETQNHNESFPALIASSFKKAILSATNLSGLTSGKVREFGAPRPSPPPPKSNFQGTNVVSFPVEEKQPQPAQPAPHLSPLRPSLPSDVGREEISHHEALGSYNDGNATSNNINPVNGGDLDQSANGGSPGSWENISIANGGVKEKDQLTTVPKGPRRLRERRVPTTPFSRALGFAGLGASLAWGTLQESAKRLVFGMPNSQDKKSAISPFLSTRNAERLALALCRMRGAALKLGQMLSIQDESVVPPPVHV